MRRNTTSIPWYQRMAVLGAILLFQLAAAAPPALAVTVEVTMSKMVYKANNPVKAKVTITGDPRPIKGVLRVETFNEQSHTQIDFREYPVNLPADGSKVHPYVIAPTPAPDASYRVVAAFYSDRDGLPEVEDSARFGVRPPGFPAGVSAHILKAEVPSLNVPGILKQLEAGASGKGPVQLNIGSQQVTVLVERQELLAKGVEIPGLGRPPVFVGKILNKKGEKEEASMALFTVTNGQLGGTLQMPLDTAHLPPGKIPEGTTDSMFIQPLSTALHDDESGLTAAAAAVPPDQHLTYMQKDTIPPPGVSEEGHGHALDKLPPEALLLQRSAEALPQAVAPEALPVAPLVASTFNHAIHIQVYEDHGAGASGYHWNLIVNWANQIYSKYATGVLRSSGASVVRVPTIFFSRWQQINTAHYGNSCGSNLNTFWADTEAGLNGPPTAPFPANNSLQILFTTKGTDCGGIAFVGKSSTAGSGKRMYSLTRDVNGSASYDTMVLMQEVGHNLDWHDNWSCVNCASPIPHDPHLSPQISESYTHFHFFSSVGPFIGDSKHCTAMHGGYGGCHEPEPVYSWGAGTAPLMHLAEGIAQLFPGTP